MLLKWHLTHDVDSLTALKTLSSAYPHPLFRWESYSTSQGHSSCPTEQAVQGRGSSHKSLTLSLCDQAALLSDATPHDDLYRNRQTRDLNLVMSPKRGLTPRQTG
jgi:hypothetical protein